VTISRRKKQISMQSKIIILVVLDNPNFILEFGDFLGKKPLMRG